MNKDLREKLELNKDKIITIGIILLIFIAIGFVYKVDANREKSERATSNKTSISSNKAAESPYIPTAEEKSILKKSYEELINNIDYTKYSELDKKYDSMSEDKKQSIKADIERLRNEKDIYNKEAEKQSEQNKQLYSDFKNEIDTNYPDMQVSSIIGKDDKKSLIIFMNLLYNITATEEKCCELTVMKETRMKEIGINDICFMIQDKNKKQHGSIIFKLKNGEYEPFANTIN